GWSLLHVLGVPPPARRYERALVGELVHLDIKKLARIVRPGHRVTGDRRDSVEGAGWECAHMAVDDASRVALREVLPTPASIAIPRSGGRPWPRGSITTTGIDRTPASTADPRLPASSLRTI